MRKRRSLPGLQGALKPLLAFFGRRPAGSLTWGDTLKLKYREWRASQGRAAATINQELAALRRMCRVGVKDGKLSAVPVIETPDPKNARTRSEVLGLRWDQVDFEAGVDGGTIMKLCGWDTRAMFDRYNIIDERDLRAGVQKLAGVTSESHSGSSAESSPT